MKTEIKFKVFIKNQNRIICVACERNDTYILFAEGGKWYVYDTSTGKDKLIASWENDTLIRNIGHKDKNGKEIYEGNTVMIDGWIRGVVKYDNASFYVKGTNDISYYRWMDYEVEVIENTHTNTDTISNRND